MQKELYNRFSDLEQQFKVSDTINILLKPDLARGTTTTYDKVIASLQKQTNELILML